MNDEELLRRFQIHKDLDAFAELERRLRPELHAYVLHRVRDPHYAEDVTQEVFLRLCSKAPLAIQVSVRAWVFGVARNCCVNHGRTLRRSRLTSLRPDEDGEVDFLCGRAFSREADPKDETERKELMEVCRAKFQQLSGYHQTLLTLYWGEDVRAEDLAEAMGKSVRAIRYHLAEARRLLLEDLLG